MKILVINAGSSSLKFRLFETVGEKVLARGLYDGLGKNEPGVLCAVSMHAGGEETRFMENLANHGSAIDHMTATLLSSGTISSLEDIAATAHRVVHGGERYSRPVVVDDGIIDGLRKVSSLAPLHNPINIACIEIMRKIMPIAPHYAVFDTAFHQTMPEEAFLYGLPYGLYKTMGIRKYGFHGTNHRYAAERAAEILGRNIGSLKTITCHLGNGQSICAVKNGKSVDTSMGFTPLEGLPMGTRSGTFDPEIVLFLLKNGYDPETVERLINKESGLLGVSGISSDYRSIEKECARGNAAALRTRRLMVHRITGTIGASTAVMGGVDAVVFTGGIGENAPVLRREVMSGFVFLGLQIDEERNSANAERISADSSTVAVLVLPANEELQIAREVTSAMGI